jgi:hypothetical protein
MEGVVWLALVVWTRPASRSVSTGRVFRFPWFSMASLMRERQSDRVGSLSESQCEEPFETKNNLCSYADLSSGEIVLWRGREGERQCIEDPMFTIVSRWVGRR